MSGKNAGRRGARWELLKARLRAMGEDCCRCEQPIDYSLAWPDPGSFSVDHYPHPLSTHPHLAEDPANVRAAHFRCNLAAGRKGAEPGLGDTAEQW